MKSWIQESRYYLNFPDGSSWVIRSGDSQTVPIVDGLGTAMGLSRLGIAKRHLIGVVLDDRFSPLPPTPRSHNGKLPPVVCRLQVSDNSDMITIQMMRLSLVIAREVQSRGGVLIHGALAKFPVGALPNRGVSRLKGKNPYFPEVGVILAGPGTMGKSTASRRFAPPWKSLSDDATLVMPDGKGQYWAHPWPTWSLFYDNGPGGSWDVERAVPLGAIFLLGRSKNDYIQPITAAMATSALMSSVHQVTALMVRGQSEKDIQDIYRQRLKAVNAIVRNVPVHKLHLSLHGQFWKEIENVMSENPNPVIHPSSTTDTHAISIDKRIAAEENHDPKIIRKASENYRTSDWVGNNGLRPVVFMGQSMLPTLQEPDVLEVVPYNNQPILPGDIVYFQSPIEDKWVVHRVVRVTSKGIRTKGDNNFAKDGYFLHPSDITGKVIAAWDTQRRRVIPGGKRGRIIGGLCHVRNRIMRHRLYFPIALVKRDLRELISISRRRLARSAIARKLTPTKWRPRLFRFESRGRVYLKLIVGDRVVGRYNDRECIWHIRFPFDLLVDESRLPRPRYNS